MDDYELYFENDAARMDEDLLQYQIFNSNRLSNEVFSEVVFQDIQINKQLTFSSSNLSTLESDRLEAMIFDRSLSIVCRQGKKTKKLATYNKNMDYAVYSDKQTKSKLIQKKYKDLKADKIEIQYPTKNFLQNFKGAHYDYLRKYFSEEELEKYIAVDSLKGKNSVSRALYQQLYNIVEFQSVFEKMFAEKFLYRSMMLSRSESTAKKNHEKKIRVFEQAFRSKVFIKIN